LIVAIVPEHKNDTVNAFLHTPQKQQANLRQVCINMNDGYSNAVQETLPAVEIVVDRFHIAKH
jgi:transposase